jgi:hypothetical protein
MGEYVVPIVIGLGTAAVSAGGAAYGASERKSAASKARRRQRAMWAATAYASPQEREAAMGKLGQARLASYQSLASELAGRGMGAGSGVGAKRMEGIERGYGKAYSHMLTEFAKPRYPYRPGTEQWGGIGPGGAAAGAGADILEQAMGMLMASKMMKGGQQRQQSPYANLYNDPAQGGSFKNWFGNYGF